MVVIDLLREIVQQTFWVFYEGGLYILFGFAIGGVVHVLLRPERIVRHLGGRTMRSAVIAALIGAPLPLCSCGVLPTALSLRRKGASREATLSFLISTPETGVDSLAVTVAFFGPLMAFIRWLVAVVSGIVAAAVLRRQKDVPEEQLDVPGLHTHSDALASYDADPVAGSPRSFANLRAKTRIAMRYAFRDLFDEIGFWLALALVATGIVSAILPPDFFTRVSPSPFFTMLFMIVLGAPMYICASASTPLAAVLVAKGASAGAALVFLLVGPATNAATMGVVTRVFGRSFLRAYLGAIIGVAIAAGLLTDLLFPNIAANVSVGPPAGPEILGLPKLVAAIVLAWLLAVSLWRTGLRPGLRELSDNGVAAWGWMRELRPRTVLGSRAVQVLLGLWLLSVLSGGFTQVGIGEEGLRQRLGALVGAPHAPGLFYAVPAIDQVTVVKIDEVRNRTIGFWVRDPDATRIPIPEEALYVTADENIMDVRMDVQFRVADAAVYRLGVDRPDDIVARLVRARMVEAMASRPIDRVYTDQRAEVEAWLSARVQQDANAAGLGVTVLAVRLLEVHAPGEVHDAFRDIASAHEDRLRIIHQANEYAAQTVALARGDAARIIGDAGAAAIERTAKAAADATSFTALAAEEHRAPQLTRDRLYLETAERVLPGARKIIRSTTGAPQGYELWLRDGSRPSAIPPGVPPADTTGTRAPAAPKPAGEPP